MFDNKLIFIVLFLLCAATLGLFLGYLLKRFLNKIYTVPKDPDELENLIMLEARKNVSRYYLCTLIIVSSLLSNRLEIEKDTIRIILLIFLAGGLLFERIAIKTISKKFTGQ